MHDSSTLPVWNDGFASIQIPREEQRKASPDVVEARQPFLISGVDDEFSWRSLLSNAHAVHSTVHDAVPAWRVFTNNVLNAFDFYILLRITLSASSPVCESTPIPCGFRHFQQGLYSALNAVRRRLWVAGTATIVHTSTPLVNMLSSPIQRCDFNLLEFHETSCEGV